MNRINWALSQKGLTPAEKLTLIGFVSFSDYKGRCALSNAHLGERIGLSPITISRAVSTLSKRGFIKNTRRWNNSSIRNLLIDNLILEY